MKHLTALALWIFLVATTWAAASTAHAQLTPRFGLGFQGLLSTEDGLGFGFQGRASAPINSDLSAAVDLGFSGFVLGGRSDATYIFHPQLSAIITLPYRSSRAPYLLAGLGAYVPLSNEELSANGPTIHFGLGWARLLNETTLFYEIDPALIIDEESIDLALPFRVGLIF